MRFRSTCPDCPQLQFVGLGHTAVSLNGAIAFTLSVPIALSKNIKKIKKNK